MCVVQKHLKWALMLLFLPGAVCSMWRVEYHQQSICAVKGSSVIVLCSFYHPDNLTARAVMWGHVKTHRSKGRLIYLRKGNTRFQYIGDKQHNCSLKIRQVQHSDAGKYMVKVNKENMRRSGTVSPTLKILDLNISLAKPDGNRTTKEGDSVNLTCTNACDDGNQTSAFTWFMNGEPINEGPVLYLNNLSSANSGNYTCSLKTHTGTTSGVINIDVEYGPENTSVSVTPSVEVDAGDNITLICSSHANPPVENYTWFKINSDDIVDVGHQPVIVSHDGGQYFCSAANKHGSQNSTVVTLKIKHYRVTFTRDALIISTVAVLLIVTIVIVRGLKRKKKWSPKTDCAEDLQQNTEYINWLVCDNSPSQEGEQCEGKITEVVYATVHFNNKRKSDMEQQRDSDDNRCVIYSTVCRTQMWNPPYSEPL